MPARILVIEDNPANLELMIYLLKAFGYETLRAMDGEEGLELARREMPDLIICDIQLPKIDGYEVARVLKKHPLLRRIPLVAVTAFAMVGDRDRVLAAGFDGYISKPIIPETFVLQAEALLPDSLHSTPPVDPTVITTTTTTTTTGIKRASILAVDNSPVNLELLRSILEPSGYEVVTASNIHTALAMALEAPPDLILSDVHMPDGDGYEFIKNVKAHPKLETIPFAFLSATILHEFDRRKGLRMGADKFIMRPIDPQELLAEIEECMSGKKKE